MNSKYIKYARHKNYYMGHSIVGRVREALKSERRMVRVSPWEQNVVAVTGYRLCTSGLIKYVNILTIMGV